MSRLGLVLWRIAAVLFVGLATATLAVDAWDHNLPASVTAGITVGVATVWIAIAFRFAP